MKKELTLKHSKYFEGNIQLRNPKPEVVQWIKNRTLKDNKALIVKETLVTNGVDLYFSDQHYMQALGKKLRERWPGEYKVSYTLHTVSHVTSKELYRVTILFRMLKFNVGDVIHVDDSSVQVLRIGKQVLTRNTKSGKKKRWKITELERFIEEIRG